VGIRHAEKGRIGYLVEAEEKGIRFYCGPKTVQDLAGSLEYDRIGVQLNACHGQSVRIKYNSVERFSGGFAIKKIKPPV
jgi:hypothetical protein